jgi:hypothetical protein
MFDVLVTLRREYSGNWTIQLVTLVLSKEAITSIICTFLQQTTISLVSKRVEVVGLFGMGLKTGLQKGIPASLFPFGSRQIAGVAKTGSLSLARLRVRSG